MERLPKERFLSDSFDAGVERGRPQFLEGLGPPGRYESPAHTGEIAIAVALGHYIYRIGGADIVARRQISGDRNVALKMAQALVRRG